MQHSRSGNGFFPNDYPPQHSHGGSGGRGGRGQSSGNGLTQRQALGNLSNQPRPASNSTNFAKKPPPKPKKPIPPQQDNGVVDSINTGGGGFIQPSKRENRSILFLAKNVIGGVPLSQGDNVKITYIHQDDQWVATEVERLPSNREISMS